MGIECDCSECMQDRMVDTFTARQKNEITSLRNDVEILRTALQELVDRRRKVADKIGHLTGQTFEGSDGRYARAQEALDATK